MKYIRHTVFAVLTMLVLAGCGEEESSSGIGDEEHDHAALATSESGVQAEVEIHPDGQQLYTCGMHPHIVQEEPGYCPICGMELVPVQQSASAEGVVAVDPVTIQNIGVRTATVEVAPLQREIRTTGRFEMDEQGTTRVSLKVGGWIEVLHADYEGVIVHEGEPLLELYSPELVSAQEEYLLALRNVQRLREGPAASDAERLVEAARRRLAYWDLDEEEIRRLEGTGTPQRTITFFAPASGEVMHKKVAEGEHIRPGQALMDIVDVSRVWLMVDVYEQDLAWVDVGTPARIELPYHPGQTYAGRVDHVYHMLDRATRAARARIVLPGGHHAPTKPGMYATVYLQGRATRPGPIVPEEAVLRTGEREVVVLALGDGRFRPVEVEVGLEANGRAQVLEGLSGGERIVTSAQFLIDSEARLKSAVGAMTAHDHE